MEISILVLTYNHEKFVRQALDSIVMQKINVPYEIIILDDASTDGTADILMQYKKKYPEKITLYLRKANSGFPTRNVYFLLSKATGKYFAYLEGDDYWLDCLKIQKQYECLERHREFSGCMTDVLVVDAENNVIGQQVYERKEDGIYTLEDFRHLKAPGMTASFFARNYFDPEEYRILYKADKMMGDITSYMLCLLKGDIYQISEVMTAYRYVCDSGKNNFNSMHQGDIYRDYMLARYWIRLENHMRQYDRSFAFAPMVDVVGQLAARYPMKCVIKLLMQADYRKKYVGIFGVYKYLLDSRYLPEKVKGRKFSRHDSWRAFKKDKAPVVLFGSGAVAAEYIDKYAWQGNILFLADNDKKRQNTSMKGFLIKAPEEIIRYKDKAKVLITNQFHEAEIAKQLEEMGIEHYYGYCSMQTNRIRNIMAKALLDKMGG